MNFVEPEYKRAPQPIMETQASTGFQSPAHDYVVKKLDLNELLMRSPYATFFVWVDHSEIEGIERGDLLVLNRALLPKHGKIAVVCIDGKFHLRRLERSGKLWFFLTDKTGIREKANNEAVCWGVVDAIIHLCWS